MRTVFVLFDSLNRLALGAYGGDAVATPNFDRFAKKAVTFDRHYTGSLPCMPARRDIHTGRLNFLHRSWGPLEPYDNSVARCLSENQVYTHIVTDHDHYFEDGGVGYVNKYDTWDFIRGQASDKWAAMVTPPVQRYRETYDDRHYELSKIPDTIETVTEGSAPYVAWRSLQTIKNREAIIDNESQFPSVKCFQAGLKFIDDNQQADNWFLHIETFDPHEPFYAPTRFRDALKTNYSGKILDYPTYLKVEETEDEIDEIRANYCALIALCDEQLGKLLDHFDAHDLWKDTALLLSTDHGFLLAEHDMWGKNRMPYYEEISHIPLIAWHPGIGQDFAGTRCNALTQTTDLMPTFLDLHGCDIPAEVKGESFLQKMLGSDSDRKGIILGMFGGPICVTDGRYTYFKYPINVDGDGIFEYTLMPNHMAFPFQPFEFEGVTMSEPFDFTKGIKLMRIAARKDAKRPPSRHGVKFLDAETALYDLHSDPRQQTPISDQSVIDDLSKIIIEEFKRHDAPPEMYAYYDVK